MSVGNRIHKAKTNNVIVFIEENEIPLRLGRNPKINLLFTERLVKRFRCCYKIIFIICAKDVGQWGSSRFPRKLKFSPNSHSEVQAALQG